MRMSVFEKLPSWAIQYQQRVALLIQSFGQRHGLPAGSDLIDGQAFEFDGVAMSYRYDANRTPTHLTVAVDFGPLPTDDPTVVRELLEVNHAEFMSGSVYAVAPETKHVVLFASLPVDGLTDERLDRSLKALCVASRRQR